MIERQPFHMCATHGDFDESSALSLIPPLAILPILFIAVGLGELAKVLLIIIGVAPIMMRDLALRTAELPVEQMIKAQTLGASTWQLIIRVVMPQLWPRLIDALRLSLASWKPHRECRDRRRS